MKYQREGSTITITFERYWEQELFMPQLDAAFVVLARAGKNFLFPKIEVSPDLPEADRLELLRQLQLRVADTPV